MWMCVCDSGGETTSVQVPEQELARNFGPATASATIQDELVVRALALKGVEHVPE